MSAKPLHRTHCPQGHAYTEVNTYLWRGYKVCRACRVVKHRKEAEERRSWRRDPALCAVVEALREGGA